MYTTGMPNVSLGFFSAASEAVAIPTGIQIFCFLATLWAGRLVRSVPMLWAAGALAIFVLGGLTGVMVALAPFDFQAHDTYFVVAHLHYVLVGGVVFPVVAGLYYFFPVATGKLLSPKLGKLAFWLMFVGFNVGFLPMHLTGLVGMPRRVFTYPSGMGFDTLNLVSTLGAYVLAAGVAVLVLDVLRPKKAAAPRNPWAAGTLEWLPPLPTPGYSVRAVPAVHSRYPLWQQPGLVRRVDAGDGYLPDAEEGLRETLITTTVDARPLQCFRVPGPSWWPFWAAVFIGAAFIVVTFGWYASAAVAMALGIAAVLGWLWTGTGRIPEKDCKDVGQGVTLPLYASGPRATGWWALCITLVGDMAAFLALLFGYFYYWTIHAAFPAAGQPRPETFWLLLGLALLLAAWVAMLLARQVNARGPGWAIHGVLALALVLAGAGAAALLRAPAGLEPTAHVYPAIVWVLVGWTVLHVAVGMLMQAWCIARRLGGYLDARHPMDLDNSTLFWHFTAVTAVLAVLVLALFPELS
jgi:cytochrome c oxidase subunit I+III